MRRAVALLIVVLALSDLAWNLAHFNCGLPDIFGLAAFARGLAQNGAWPATPYFPAGYPLLLIPGGLLGNALAGGYLLSAGGLALALWALYRLVREFGLARWVGLLAIIAAWLMPVYRLPAGSPSVDALYTGLGLWFVAAAIALWRVSTQNPCGEAGPDSSERDAFIVAGELPRWIGWGLVVPAVVLPLMRYHAVLLVLPVLLVLLLWRPRLRQVLLWPCAGFIAMAAFNYFGYYIAHGEPLPPVAGIQMRCGLEFDYRVNYDRPERVFQDYAAFSENARNSSIVADYGWPLIAKHTLKSWLLYLRRPPVLLAFGLILLGLALRRRLPAGAALLALWIAMYSLMLSPAYYTPRAALPVVMASVALSLTLATSVGGRRFRIAGPIAAAVLLLAGGALASGYARLYFAERLHYARLSAEFNRLMQINGWANGQVVTTDARVIPLNNNPWGAPFPHTEVFWTEDSAVRPAQTPGILRVPVENVAAGLPGCEVVLYKNNHPLADELQAIADSPAWRSSGELDGFTVLVRSEQASAACAETPGACAPAWPALPGLRAGGTP